MKLLKIGRLPRGIVFFIFVLSFVFVLTSTISDPDLFWHLATGKWIWEHRSLPDADPFSFTVAPAAEAQYYRIPVILKGYWLGQIVLYGSYLAGNYWGIIILRIVIYSLIMSVLYIWLREIGLKRSDIFFFAIPLAYVLSKYVGDRPNQFTYLFSTLCLYCIFLNRRNQKRGIFLILVMFLWANIHGGFILGMALITIVLIYDTIAAIHHRARKIEYAGYVKRTVIYTLSLIVCGLNPTGYDTFLMLMEPRPSYAFSIAETLSPFTQFSFGKHYPLFIVLFSSFIFITAVIFGRRNKAKDVTLYVLLFLFLLALSLNAHRFTPFLPLLTAPLVACLVKDHFEKMNLILKKGMLGVLLVLFVSYAVFSDNRTVLRSPFLNNNYPDDLIEFINNNELKGNIFNSYDIGGYLIWRLHPEIKVFIDNRRLVEQAFGTYKAVISGSTDDLFGLPEWKSILQGYGIQHIILSSLNGYGTMPDLVLSLHNDRDWRLLYFDKISGTMLYSKGISIPEYPKIFAYTRMLDRALRFRSSKSGNAEIYVTIANIYMLMGRKSEAIRVIENAIENYPSFQNGVPGKWLDHLQKQ